MYDFYDKGDRHVTLRPEGTAPIVRAYVENKLFGPEYAKPYKVYYTGPMFRYERPQKGRLRQFHQIGVEAFGSTNPATDVETIAMAVELLGRLGINNSTLHINTLGNRQVRLTYREALINYFQPHFDELSEDSQRRLHENPLRVLDSKDKRDIKFVADAPSILDFLDEESTTHFETVKAMLNSLNIAYEVDTSMVRGLDYYNHTIFEIMNDSIGGAQSTIVGGGRYDSLVEYFGGPETPGFGWGLGIERIILTMQAIGVELPKDKAVEAYVVGLGEKTNIETLKIVQMLRGQGFSAERDFLGRSAKAQFKTIDKIGAQLVVTIGESELEEDIAKVKNAKTRKEATYLLTQIYEDFQTIYDELMSEE
jgi:histidyl-tRNA synthetase